MIKKLALVRTLLNQSRIVILHDIDVMIDSINILAVLREVNPGCTIIKLAGKDEQIEGVKRLIKIVNSEVTYDVSGYMLFNYYSKLKKSKSTKSRKSSVGSINSEEKSVP